MIFLPEAPIYIGDELLSIVEHEPVPNRSAAAEILSLDVPAGSPHTPRPMIFTPNLLALELSLPHAGREGVA